MNPNDPSPYREPGAVSKKCDDFIVALNKLCREHGVQLSTELYDGLQVWDLRDGEEPVLCDGIEDMTGQ
jgi:hypothetical protein